MSVINGPFEPNEHTGPTEISPDEDEFDPPKRDMIDVEGDPFTIEWQFSDELIVRAGIHKYLMLSSDNLLEMQRFLEDSDDEYKVYLETPRGKRWCKENDC